ncbi:MAG TPA: histidine phosphatase family protein, partial [Candidatus Melainabacteria bacterium]|nr:histidine phosphatase family protein [Candidatus Melainabacteria bacterium]
MSEELHPPETITTIYLIRHGHTEPTENGKLYNDPDVELTEGGREQARALGEWLADHKPD